MLSRKKTKNEVSKPAEVQGKYVKKETSPLLRSECRGAVTGGGPGEAPGGAGRRTLGNARLCLLLGENKVLRPAGVLVRWVGRGVPGVCDHCGDSRPRPK